MTAATLPARDTRKADFEAAKRRKRIRRLVGEAIADFSMIGAGDKVMACLSGGKDSYALLDVLLHLRDCAPVPFEVVAVNLDQRHPGYPEHVLPDYLASRDVPYRIVVQDTHSVVKRVIPEGKTMCSLCSRLRRGVLYRVAKEIGATRIALGHHRDDILETFFLNLFHNGKIKAMSPKLVSDDGRHVVIRPLAYVEERDLARLRRGPQVPHHPVRPVRLAGKPAAKAGEGDAARMGEKAPRARDLHLQRPHARDAFAPDGSRALRFCESRGHGTPQAEGRHRPRSGTDSSACPGDDRALRARPRLTRAHRLRPTSLPATSHGARSQDVPATRNSK